MNNINKIKNGKNTLFKNTIKRNNSKSYFNIYHNDNKSLLKNQSERNINNNRIIYRNINHKIKKIPYYTNVYLTDYNENMNYLKTNEEYDNNYMEHNNGKPNKILYYY